MGCRVGVLRWQEGKDAKGQASSRKKTGRSFFPLESLNNLEERSGQSFLKLGGDACFLFFSRSSLREIGMEPGWRVGLEKTLQETKGVTAPEGGVQWEERQGRPPPLSQRGTGGMAPQKWGDSNTQQTNAGPVIICATVEPSRRTQNSHRVTGRHGTRDDRQERDSAVVMGRGLLVRCWVVFCQRGDGYRPGCWN